MVSLKTILDNELLKEIIQIRTNTLWKMLALEEQGKLPEVNEEGATGKYDNKGAIFVPGGLIIQDVDENKIKYTPFQETTPEVFRENVRKAMRYDNATLLYPDGMAAGITIDGGFFSKAARRISTFKKAALRRKKTIGSSSLFQVSSDDIIRSHCPTFFSKPYGSRTRISTYMTMGLIEPAMFFAYCQTELNLCDDQIKAFTELFDQVREPVKTSDDLTLYNPHIVVCHDSRYAANSYTGMTRILGIGKFGEFATFTLEEETKKLKREIKRKKLEYSREDFFARYHNKSILGMLRIYATTNPGKRSTNYRLHIVSPIKDLNLQPDVLEKEAREQYNIEGQALT